MRIHENIRGQLVCDNAGSQAPCTGDHLYKCRRCDEEFVVNLDTQVSSRDGHVYASFSWPYHSTSCAEEAYIDGDLLAIPFRQRQLVETEREER